MSKIEKSPLRALFWKDEILQIMYWMDGEGLGSSVPAKQILALLNTDEDNLLYHLQKMVNDGWLEMDGHSMERDTLVNLSASSKKEAGRRFSEAFQGISKSWTWRMWP